MPRPLTIALANSGRHWIGEVAHVAMLYEQFEALGHRPWIVARRGCALEKRAKVNRWRCLSLEFSSRFNPLSDLRDAWRWARWVKREKVDLLHCHRGKDHWTGLWTARLSGRPLVRTRHVTTPVQNHFMNRFLFLRGTQGVVCVSDAARAGFPEAWREHLPLGGRVILAAVDSENFRPELRSEDLRSEWQQKLAAASTSQSKVEHSASDTIWFGLVGRLQRIKGHRYFVDAAGEVAHHFPAARFWIAGSGPEDRRESLHVRARQRLVGDKLLVFDWLDDLPAALASLDVGVIASIGSEGSSRIALEMMASGLPLVATKVGGIPNQAGPSAGTRLVEPHDPHAMAQEMLHLARQAQARRRAAEANRDWVMRNYQPRDWAQKMIGVYEEVLGAAGRA